MKVVIAGGGIGGMSAALALLRYGHEVQVYERASELSEVGAGIQISPNGSRVLDHLGTFEELSRTSCTPERKEFRLWNSGKSWPLFDLGRMAVEKYGYPYLTVYRPDLLGAIESGVHAVDPTAIRLGSQAVGVEQSADSATVLFADGSRATGDVVIGADGWRSAVRAALWGEISPAFSGMVAWRGLIDWAALPSHMRQMVGSTWIGPGGHSVSYPLHGGEIMNFVATIEGKTWHADAGSEPGTAEECHEDFSGWHEDVHTMIDQSPALSKWALMQWEPISAWSAGRISLLGDAAHATLPFLAQGAVHSMEDGVVLARALTDYYDPSEALKRYEAARIDRTSEMVRGATGNTGRFHARELATPEGADAYMEQEFSEAPIADRYDWLYAYDAVTAPV